jgi:hypothetical protein
VLAQQVEPENKNGRLDAAATPPAEARCVSGSTPSVWKKKVWCSCEAESCSRVAAAGSPGESTKSCGAHAKPCLTCALRPWDRRGRAPNRESGPG